MEKNHGYSMPLPVKYWPRVVSVAVWMIFVVVSLVSLIPAARNRIPLEEVQLLSIRITAVLAAPIFLGLAASCAAKLHIAPQGIALTLFGRTVRHIPAEKIRVISAVKCSAVLDQDRQIAVCMIPLEEMNCTTAEELYQHLRLTARHLRVSLNLYRHILWLDWSPERVKLLQQMYPQAQWMEARTNSLKSNSEF